MKIKVKSKGFMLNYMNANDYNDDEYGCRINGDDGVNITNDMLDLGGGIFEAKINEYLGYKYTSIQCNFNYRWDWPEWAVEVIDES